VDLAARSAVPARAHDCRDAEIVHGKTLVPNATPPPDSAYAGETIAFEANGVFSVVINPAVHGYAPGSAPAINNRTNTLHLTFNGEPNRLTAAIDLWSRSSSWPSR
jgi:hypothetical protein